ncbi:hypothetical protein B0T10DRAFT_531112 [Thelonectria olida]|uniref:Uncharacterized protein n=1 Tax=Thelonectria olida TaxID=1576542 RepID=A0A9P9AMH6_9HYPO|nr:hypothetical protein B0T10DRAFT_531112 [Thelonectria olida]
MIPESEGRKDDTSSLGSTREHLPGESLTAYDAMVLQSHEVQKRYNFAAAAANWLLLAGFMVFPGTFTSLSRAGVLNDSRAGRVLQHAIRNTPLLYIGGLCCLCGGIAICWLWWHFKHNYFWLVYRIFLPGLLHSVMALITSLINIYTAQDGNWSVTAIATVYMTGICALLMGSITAVYQLWFLEKLKAVP